MFSVKGSLPRRDDDILSLWTRQIHLFMSKIEALRVLRRHRNGKVQTLREQFRRRHEAPVISWWVRERVAVYLMRPETMKTHRIWHGSSMKTTWSMMKAIIVDLTACRRTRSSSKYRRMGFKVKKDDECDADIASEGLKSSIWVG